MLSVTSDLVSIDMTRHGVLLHSQLCALKHTAFGRSDQLAKCKFLQIVSCLPSHVLPKTTGQLGWPDQLGISSGSLQAGAAGMWTNTMHVEICLMSWAPSLSYRGALLESLVGSPGGLRKASN